MKRKLLKKQIELMRSTANVVMLISGIGFGKTYTASLKAAISLIEGRHIIITAQSYRSLKLVLFEEIQERLRELGVFDDCTVNKSDMTIIYESSNGKIFGFSTDSVESVRGITADMLIMDEAALADNYVYRVLQGRLRRVGYKMQTILISTPRGTENWLYDMSLRKDVHFIHALTRDNLFLPSGFYEQLLLDYDGDEALMRQELEASFEDFEDDNLVISPVIYRQAVNRIPDEPLAEEKKIMGFDVARKGKDRSALVTRHGNHLAHYLTWRDTDIVESCEKVVAEVIKQGIDILVVDGVGLGAGAYDILAKKLKSVCEVVNYNGAFRAINKSEKYANARAESYFLLRNWLLNGGALPDDDQFKEMTAVKYTLNAKNKIQLETKSALEKSPDVVDALSITFSSKVKEIKKPSKSSRSHRPKNFIG